MEAAEEQATNPHPPSEMIVLPPPPDWDVCAPGLTELIDRHLSHIYPVYWARTRAILLRQARDLLVDHYQGSLTRFEQRFLCKFAQIAATLRATHQIGEVSVSPWEEEIENPQGSPWLIWPDISFSVSSGLQISAESAIWPL